MTRGLLLLAVTAILCGASPATAHRGHSILTVVEISATAGTVVVTHRLSAHDVEPALASIARDTQRTLDDPAAVARLEAHLRQRFRLRIDDQETIIAHAGTRLAGDTVRLEYRGRTDDASIQRVVVDADFFPGVHDDQEQQVNVRVNGVTRTVLFRPGAQAQTLDFAAAR